MRDARFCASVSTLQRRSSLTNGNSHSLIQRSGHHRTRRRCSALSVGCALLFGYAMIPQVKAGIITNFTGSYALNQFTLANINIQPLANPDGTASSPDGGLSLLLTGGLSGSGSLGETDFFIGAAATGTVQFDWLFSNGVPGFISGGYLVGARSTSACAPPCITLSDASGSGEVSFGVTQGEIFGFFVITDNQANPVSGEPGVLTVTNFSAPTAASPVPEPSTAATFVLACAGAAAFRWRRLASQCRKSL
jgi:hypothetical protein